MPPHMLWRIVKIKVHYTDIVCAFLFACDEATFGKWSWLIINGIVSLYIVSSLQQIKNWDGLALSHIVSLSNQVKSLLCSSF